MEAPSDPSQRQSAAVLAWLNSLRLDAIDAPDARDSIKAWRDPAKLYAVCQTIDANHFKCDEDLDTLIDEEERLDALKGLYTLLIQYFSNNLRLSTSALPSVKLESIASDGDEQELAKLLSQILAMVVMSPSKEAQVSHIQSLPEWVQRELMVSIEHVRSQLSSPNPSNDIASSSFVSRPSEDALATMADPQEANRMLQSLYDLLKREHASLKEEHEDSLAALQKAESRRSEAVPYDNRAEAALRAELDRLRSELSRSETIIAESEDLTSKQEKTIEELTKRMEELGSKAEQADRLNDQMDEYKHVSDKLRKMENVIDKYKRKLEESAEARRMVKTLEEENLTLLEKNAALEEEYKKVSAFKPLLENYKSTIAGLEAKNGSLNKEKEDLRYQLEQSKARLASAEEEGDREREAVALLEERVQELEMAGKKTLGSETKRNGAIDEPNADDSDNDEEDENDLSGIANELDDVLTGRTTTDLKLQIRKLKRELETAQANKADASKIVILENLLEDTRKMKARYEEQYLSEHRANLVLQSELEEIRSGKSNLGDGAEVAMALRMRLNEVVEEFERTRQQNMEAEQKLLDAQKDLAIARSDLALVDKDQLEVLATLRASVSTEKQALDAEVKSLKSDISKLQETTSMQMSQINTLLMDKVNLQSDGLTQRERLLARESESKPNGLANASNESVASLEVLKHELAERQQEVEQMKDKLQKARNFIRQQDKLFKDQHAAMQANNPFEAAEQSFKAQIQALQEELDRQKALNEDIEQRYSKEQRLMLSAWQEIGMQNMRSEISQNGAVTGSKVPPASWLAQQRSRMLVRQQR